MKISKQKLKKIIAEEIANVEEGLFGTTKRPTQAIW